MSGTAAKRKLRLENKQKKMAALMNVVKLNEHDKARKNKKLNNNEESEPLEKRLKVVNNNQQTCKENGTISNAVEDQLPFLIGEHNSPKPIEDVNDFKALKTMLRERTKKRRQIPQFRLRDLGDNASLTVDINDRVPLFVSDLQHLIMYSQIGVHSPYTPARWCALDKYNRLLNTNILIVENLSLYHYVNNESHMPFLTSKFKHKLEMVTPATYQGDIVQGLSMVPLTGTQMKKFINSFGNLESAVQKSDELFDMVINFFPIEEQKEETHQSVMENLPAKDCFPRTQLLLSGWQMVEENYPLPIKGLMERKYSGYVLTKDKYKHVTPFSPLIAIDCEMCRTSSGDLELTRVSAVDENHKVFYDTLVKPDNEIIDYLTRWSGINKKMMKDVTKKLKDVQEELRKMLPEDAILIGQSLSNDLHALKMMHPYIIDTSVIYNITGDRNRKTKLQVLAREFLTEKIQMDKGGHCSKEDSLACMKLVQLKLKKSIYYGDAVMGNISNELRRYPAMGTSQYATSMLRQCVKVDKTAQVISVNEITDRYKFYIDKGQDCDVKNVRCTSGKSNKEVIEKYVNSMVDYSLNVGHVKMAESDIEADVVKVLRTLDEWIKEIYDASPYTSLIAVLLGGYKTSNGVCFLELKRDNIP